MRLLSKMFLIVLISQVPQFLLLAQDRKGQAHGIKIKALHRLSNSFAGKSKFLTVSDDGDVIMADLSTSGKQFWRLTPIGDGSFRLQNAKLGSDKSLDVDENDELIMSDKGDYSGQSWTLTHLGGGKYRLTNEYSGVDKSLDCTKNGNQYSVIMGDTGNLSGQFWTFTEVVSSE